MTTLSPPPIRENILQFAEPEPEPEPPSRWRRFIPHSRRGKAATAGGLTVLLVAGVLGATYETSPGGTLWGVEKTIFPEHSQDVALTAVVSDLKQAQDILGSGQQPTPDQLTDARTSLNHAKQDLDYLSASPQRTSLQNLYLQLTQQLLQYTPDSVQQLPPLPVPPPAADPSQAPDVALTSASAPSWGYPITDQAGTLAPDDFGPPPPGVPDAPLADWSQPYSPPPTPNLDNLGYYDPSWGQLYGYDPTDWYNYGLNGYNQYGYDFLGFDRWGYDRWGYDRWGYDHRGYNWAGYTWAGYDRNGWDRDGRNDWGQRRDHPGDPRNQDWYNDHHAYEQYYQWKFQNDDPVYRRTQWDQARGFNPNLYQNWNMNRSWHDPRNRDWAPLPSATSVTGVNIHVSAPVVNLNASLTQFISNDRAANSGPSIKDLASKSTRDFTKDLAPRVTIPTGLQPMSPVTQRLTTPKADRQTPIAPPSLTAPAPVAAPSKVSPEFTAPKIAPVPAYTPPKADQPQAKPEPAPANVIPGRDHAPSPAPLAIPPKADSPDPVVAPPAESGPRDRAPAPVQSEPPRQQTVPEAPAQDAPAPKVQAPAPKEEAPAPKEEAPAPKEEAPAPKGEAPARQAPAPRAQQSAPEQPARQAPPAHEAPPARQAPAPAPRPAPEQHAAPAPSGPKCTMPSMCG